MRTLWNLKRVSHLIDENSQSGIRSYGIFFSNRNVGNFSSEVLSSEVFSLRVFSSDLSRSSSNSSNRSPIFEKYQENSVSLSVTPTLAIELAARSRWSIRLRPNLKVPVLINEASRQDV
jgi:hypothetical protein